METSDLSRVSSFNVHFILLNVLQQQFQNLQNLQAYFRQKNRELVPEGVGHLGDVGAQPFKHARRQLPPNPLCQLERIEWKYTLFAIERYTWPASETRLPRLWISSHSRVSFSHRQEALGCSGPLSSATFCRTTSHSARQLASRVTGQLMWLLGRHSLWTISW